MTPTQHLQKSAEEFRERFADDGTTSKAELKMRAESFWLSKIKEAYLIAAEDGCCCHVCVNHRNQVMEANRLREVGE